MKYSERRLWAVAVAVMMLTAILAAAACHTARIEYKALQEEYETLQEWQNRPLIITQKEN